jgi:hypothetical protein
VANLVGSVGSGAGRRHARAIRPDLNSLQEVIDQAPPFTTGLDVLLLQRHTERLTVWALQAESSAFGQQLDVPENPGSDGDPGRRLRNLEPDQQVRAQSRTLGYRDPAGRGLGLFGVLRGGQSEGTSALVAWNITRTGHVAWVMTCSPLSRAASG